MANVPRSQTIFCFRIFFSFNKETVQLPPLNYFPDFCNLPFWEGRTSLYPMSDSITSLMSKLFL